MDTHFKLPSELAEKIKKYNLETEQKISNGGHVDGDDKRTPTLQILSSFHLIIFITACIGELYSLLFAILVDFSDILIDLVILFGGIIISYLGFIYMYRIGERGFDIRPANGKSPLLLGVGNGIGFTLVGDFRTIGSTYVSYYCFVVGAPIFVLGCYRVSGGKMERTGSTQWRTNYKIYGSEKWNWSEIFSMYIFRWGILTTGIGLLSLLFNCIE